MRAIKERLMGREDKELGYALDKICHKYAEVGYDTVFSLGKSLRDIAKDADTLGCSFTIQCVNRGSRSKQMDIEDFLKVAKRHLDADSDIFFDITYIDGEEPGNQYMLTINDFDGHIEEFAEFIFTPNDDDTQSLSESKRSVRESLDPELPSTKEPLWNWYKVDVEIPTDWLVYVNTNNKMTRIKRVAQNKQSPKKGEIVVLDDGDHKNTVSIYREVDFLKAIGL